jgi:hypothetical protein
LLSRYKKVWVCRSCTAEAACVKIHEDYYEVILNNPGEERIGSLIPLTVNEQACSKDFKCVSHDEFKEATHGLKP